jgi:hypothetical protein
MVEKNEKNEKGEKKSEDVALLSSRRSMTVVVQPEIRDIAQVQVGGRAVGRQYITRQEQVIQFRNGRCVVPRAKVEAYMRARLKLADNEQTPSWDDFPWYASDFIPYEVLRRHLKDPEKKRVALEFTEAAEEMRTCYRLPAIRDPYAIVQ